MRVGGALIVFVSQTPQELQNEKRTQLLFHEGGSTNGSRSKQGGQDESAVFRTVWVQWATFKCVRCALLESSHPRCSSWKHHTAGA